MLDLQDNYFTYLELITNPSSWPKKWRRIFILTLPISFTLYLGVIASVLITIIPTLVLLMITEILYSMWIDE